MLCALWLGGCATTDETAPACDITARTAAESPADGIPAVPPPARPGLLLGEGDRIRMTVHGQPDMETTALISAGGAVTLPLIGEIWIGGMTPAEAGRAVAAAYRTGDYFDAPQVNITVDSYRSHQVAVLGEVQKPGRYPLETRTTVLDAIALAGGITETGARQVIVKHTGEGRVSFDLDALVSGEGGRGAARPLGGGDIVFVPQAELFYIYGEVRRPDAYPLRPGMTVMQALSVGGGVNERGSRERLEIRRRDDQGQLRTFEPALTDCVRPEDVIFVKERIF